MMRPNTSAIWHKASFDRFMKERLPELLASRLPLAAYEYESTGQYTCRIKVAVNNGNGDMEIEYQDLPQPDSDGIFLIEGIQRVVVPVASGGDLAEAEIASVGEQLYAFVAERLSVPSVLRTRTSMN